MSEQAAHSRLCKENLPSMTADLAKVTLEKALRAKVTRLEWQNFLKDSEMSRDMQRFKKMAFDAANSVAKTSGQELHPHRRRTGIQVVFLLQLVDFGSRATAKEGTPLRAKSQ